jgi:hypothetical protein
MQPKTSKKDNLIGIEYGDERIVNLCPHAISVISPWDNGKIIEIPQSGMIARVDKLPPDTEKHAGFTITREVYGEVYGLPDEVKGTLYVVSAPVINVLNDSRRDIVSLGRQMKDTRGATVSAIEFRRQF